jgi:hypothetical protein
MKLLSLFKEAMPEYIAKEGLVAGKLGLSFKETIYLLLSLVSLERVTCVLTKAY